MDGTTQTSATSALIAQPSTPATSPATPAATGLDWTTVIVAVITGVTTGIIAPMVSPYVKWYFDRKERLEKKNESIVEELRNVIEDRSMTIDGFFRHRYFPHLRVLMGASWVKKNGSVNA